MTVAALKFSYCGICGGTIFPGMEIERHDYIRAWCHVECLPLRYASAEPTWVTLADGSEVYCRSRVESLWVLALNSECPDLTCHECVTLPIVGSSYGAAKSYTPDITVTVADSPVTYLEIKADAESALADDRQAKALYLNQSLRFVVLGGRPEDSEGFTVRLIAAAGERVYEGCSLGQLVDLLGCI